MSSDQEPRYTWKLTPEEYHATEQKIAAINARAERRGFTGRLEITGVRTTEKVGDWPNPVRERVIYLTTLTGTPPAYGDWQLLAAIDTLPATDGGHEIILRCAPGIDDADVDRSQIQPGGCEHCNTVRSNRRHTYLVRHRHSGDIKQVGSTCLKDFLGWSGNPVFLSVADTAEELQGGGFGAGPDAYTPATVLAYAHAAVETFGWAPATFERSTKGVVSDALYGRGRVAEQTLKALTPHLPTGTALAETITSTLLERLPADHGYEANLRAALRAAYVGPRELGLLCSAIPAYQRALGAATAAAQKAAVPDEWIGQLDDKVTLTGTLTTDLTVDGYAYNSTQRLLVLTTSSGIVKMLTAAAWAYEVHAGDQISVAGTVKAHEIYRNRKQTLLRRPRRTDTPNPEETR